MKKYISIFIILFISVSLYAVDYPDSVQNASKEEYRIRKGLNFDVSAGVGVGQYMFHQLGVKYTSPHTSNLFVFPIWNAALGINGYFLPWMGIGTGVQFSTYANKTAIANPWTKSGVDYQGHGFVLTSSPEDMEEQQGMYMIEVPLTLRFRAIERNVGFHAALGAKVGLPIYDYYRMNQNAVLHNQVYYEHWDLTISNVPGVIEDAPIAGVSGEMGNKLRMLNYAAYAEIGMLFRLQQRLDLLLAISGTYYFNNVSSTQSSELGFSDSFVPGEYPSPFAANYQGVLATNEVQELHPWGIAIKLGFSINAGKTRAQRVYLQQRKEKERLARIADTKPDTVVEKVEPVSDTLQQRCETARMQIQALADECGLNLAELFCPPVVTSKTMYVRDTVFITIHDTIRIVEHDTIRYETQVAVESPVQMELDRALQTAIIWFRLDDATPILEPEDILVQIADILKEHPEQQVQINGHACELGRSAYNQNLALKRAMAVVKQLQKLGVKAEQMIVRSLGENEPFRYNSKHQLHKDRRVEIIPIPNINAQNYK